MLESTGEEKLGREIYLSDLSDDDMESMNRGFLQVLPQRDATGRQIVFYYKAITNCYKQRENIVSNYQQSVLLILRFAIVVLSKSKITLNVTRITDSSHSILLALSFDGEIPYGPIL